MLRYQVLKNGVPVSGKIHESYLAAEREWFSLDDSEIDACNIGDPVTVAEDVAPVPDYTNQLNLFEEVTRG